MSDVQKKDVQNLRTDIRALTRAIRKLTDAVGKTPALHRMELPEGMALDMDPDQVMVSMTAQAAVETLKQICKEATDCSEDCPIFTWCQAALPDNQTALPPKYWQPPE